MHRDPAPNSYEGFSEQKPLSTLFYFGIFVCVPHILQPHVLLLYLESVLFLSVKFTLEITLMPAANSRPDSETFPLFS